MAEFANSAIQAVNTNQNVLFTETTICSGTNSILHRQGSGLVTLNSRGGCPCQGYAKYRVSFGANIAVPTDGTAGAISLAIAINGEADQNTIMTVTPTATEAFFNVARTINVLAPIGCCTDISVKNVSDQTISVENATLNVERWA